MPANFEVLEVDKSPSPPGILEYEIVEPSAPKAERGYVMRIAGWAVCDSSPIVSISIREDWKVITEATLGVGPPVDSTSRGFGPASGFSAAVPLIGVRPTFWLAIVATLANGVKLLMGQINGRRTLIDLPSMPIGIAPLLITSLGRTGTTWLMHLLAGHADIVTYPQWPYELSALGYWTRTIHALMQRPQGLDRPPTFDRNDPASWWKGNNPFEREPLREWFTTDYVVSLADWARRSTTSFYSALAASRGAPKARFFAEKGLPDAQTRMVVELFPEAREIFLVRDFRAVFNSISAFNKQRGTLDFSRSSVKTDEEYVILLAESIELLLQASNERPDALVVRYEDLIGEQEKTLRLMLDYLDLPADERTVRDLLVGASIEIPEMTGHRTSRDSEESLTRWQKDLDSKTIQECNHHFGPALKAFGYL